MRAHEFVTEDVSFTTSANMATVAQPLGIQSRLAGSLLTGKYSNVLPTPEQTKNQRKPHAVRQFKNSISH